MATEIKDSPGLKNISMIEFLEQKLSFRLPKQYRKFLSKYNGGYPEPDGFKFKFKSNEDASTVDRFLGINVGKHSNLEKYLNVYSARIPDNFFPIAHDPGGNLVMIGLGGSESGKIYFWDHEFEADNSQPDMSNMYFISDSFDEFISNLYEINLE